MQILDANDKPSDINSSSLSVDENTQGDTSVVFNVLDQDVNQTHLCHITDSDSPFKISKMPDHSVLVVKNDVVLDHERNTTIQGKNFKYIYRRLTYQVIHEGHSLLNVSRE